MASETVFEQGFDDKQLFNQKGVAIVFE